MAKLQISMVVINALDYTRQAVESINTKEDYHLRIFDNASNRDSYVKWGKENDIEVIRSDNQVSLSEAWNKCIIESLEDDECEYIFLPNNDVIFHEKTIDRLIYALEQSELNMVTGENVAPNCPTTEYFINEAKAQENWEEDFKPIKNWREEGPDFSCFMLKPDLIEKVGWFDENFYPAFFEDNDYHYRMRLAGLRAKRVSSAPYYHFGSRTVHENRDKDLTSARTRPVFLEKWGAMPGGCMDGKGFKHPYNDESKNYKFWRGCKKYE